MEGFNAEANEASDEAWALVVEEVEKADCILVSVGAGLSAACGVDYTSRDVFAKFFPDMADRGFRNMYQFIGLRLEDEQLKWGYLARQVDHVRYRNEMVNKTTYDLLKILVEDKSKDNVFCATTNVDGLLHRNGHFDIEKVCEVQGTYSKMQCLAPCRADAFWDARPEIDRLLSKVGADGRTPAAPPVCPHCAGPAFLNVRGGDWFLEGSNQSSRDRYAKWVQSLQKDPKKRLVILELGCGYNTPGVLRLPSGHVIK